MVADRLHIEFIFFLAVTSETLRPSLQELSEEECRAESADYGAVGCSDHVIESGATLQPETFGCVILFLVRWEVICEIVIFIYHVNDTPASLVHSREPYVMDLH